MILIILVRVRGDRTRNPWVGNQVFYHWAKFTYADEFEPSALILGRWGGGIAFGIGAYRLLDFISGS